MTHRQKNKNSKANQQRWYRYAFAAFAANISGLKPQLSEEENC